jgi:hypothetical protein
MRHADLCAIVELRDDELHSSKQQSDIALKAHVASVCFKCFRWMAKVDQDVAYVAMVVRVCRKGLFPISDLCFRTYVANVFI